MKQEIFLQKMRYGLRGLSEQEVCELVNDCREYIADGLSAGRPMEEVVAALGDPLKLGKELKASIKLHEWERRRSFSNFTHLIFAIAGLGLVHVPLFLPFVMYVFSLIIACIVSGLLTIAGLATMGGLWSHDLVELPSYRNVPSGARNAEAGILDTGNSGGIAASGTSSVPTSPIGRVGQLTITNGRFAFDLDNADTIPIITQAGFARIRKRDDQILIEASSDKVRSLFKQRDNQRLTIACADVIALRVRDGSGDFVSLHRAGATGKAATWNFVSGDVKLAIQQDDRSNVSDIELQGDSLTMSFRERHFNFKSGDSSIVFDAPWNLTFGNTLFGLASILTLGGALGFVFFGYLIRTSWVAWIRHIKRQLATISLELHHYEAA